MAEQGFTFPVLYDTELEAMYAYQVSGLPVTLFRGRRRHPGRQGQRHDGPGDLEQGIALIAE